MSVDVSEVRLLFSLDPWPPVLRLLGCSLAMGFSGERKEGGRHNCLPSIIWSYYLYGTIDHLGLSSQFGVHRWKRLIERTKTKMMIKTMSLMKIMMITVMRIIKTITTINIMRIVKITIIKNLKKIRKLWWA